MRLVNRDSAPRRARRLAVQPDIGELSILTAKITICVTNNNFGAMDGSLNSKMDRANYLHFFPAAEAEQPAQPGQGQGAGFGNAGGGKLKIIKIEPGTRIDG